MKKTNAIRLLIQQEIDFEVVAYTYASEDLSVTTIAEENGLALESIYKTLVVKGDKTGVVVALVAGHQVLSLKKLADASGNKKMALLPIQELPKQTGYIRGGCSPIGMKKDLPVFIDQQAQQHQQIYVNAGKRGLLFACSPMDLQLVSAAQWADIAKRTLD